MAEVKVGKSGVAIAIEGIPTITIVLDNLVVASVVSLLFFGVRGLSSRFVVVVVVDCVVVVFKVIVVVVGGQ